MNDNRGELRRVERYVIRMVVLDAGNHVVLLQTRDLSNPAFNPRGNSRVAAGSPGKHTYILK
jgi:hypothetical protein